MERESIGVQQAFGATGCEFGERTLELVPDSGSIIIPPGVWLVETGYDNIVRFTYDAGSTFVTWLGNSVVDMVYSDGFNVELRGGIAGGGPAFISQVLPLA